MIKQNKLANQVNCVKYKTGIWFILIVLLMGCKETITVLPPPSITIKQVKQLSLSSFEIELEISSAERQKISDGTIELKDLTLLNSPSITENLIIGEIPVQTITHVIETGIINHDYLVKASIQTIKYRYESNSFIYRSQKNNFFFSIQEDETYQYLNPELAVQINRGGGFLLEVDFLNEYKEKIKVSLDKTIICENKMDLTNYISEGNRKKSGGPVTIPSDIQPGDYSVYITIENIDYKLDKKIRVLEGDWEIFNDKYPGTRLGDYAWFKIDNHLYVVGGEFISSTVINSPVWKMNLTNGEWQQKNDFPWPPEKYPYSKKIYPNDLLWKNSGYILMQSDEGETGLWKYNLNADSWEKITDYPGAGFELLVSFIIRDELFVGGGVKLELNNDHSVYDFWSYNMQSGEWKRLKDIPVRQLGLWQKSVNCSSSDKGYVFQFPDKLWEYQPATDSWDVKRKFPGPPRHSTRLVAFENDIYLIGGMYYYLGNISYKDFWKFTTSNNEWQLKAFRPGYPNYGIATLYDNSIIYGLGYANHGYTHYNEPIIYKYIP
jgi:hypothetical protein